MGRANFLKLGRHNGVAGVIVDWLGFSVAFLVLAGFAFAALALFALAVPETKRTA